MSGCFIRFDTSIGGTSWAGATLDVTISPDPLETWSFDTEWGDNPASGWDVANSIVDWGNAAGRAWSGAETFSVEHFNNDNFNPFVGVKITCTTSATWGPSSELEDLMGFPSSASGILLKSETASNACVGSCASLVGVRQDYKTNKLRGGVSNHAGWSGGTHVSGLKRPAVSIVSTPAESTALMAALWKGGSPRVGQFYDEAAAAFTDSLSIGKAPRAQFKGVGLYRYTFKVLGGVVD